MTEFELKKSYFPSQTVSTCNKSRHLRERGKEAVRCCLLASQQATEVISARQPFYTLLGAKLSLCETWAQSWMTARGQWGQWSRYVAPPFIWKLPKQAQPIMHENVTQSDNLAPKRKEYKRAAWLGSPQLLVDSQHSNISHTFITFYKYK